MPFAGHFLLIIMLSYVAGLCRPFPPECTEKIQSVLMYCNFLSHPSVQKHMGPISPSGPESGRLSAVALSLVMSWNEVCKLPHGHAVLRVVEEEMESRF